jgi:hypothetical protein
MWWAWKIYWSGWDKTKWEFTPWSWYWTDATWKTTMTTKEQALAFLNAVLGYYTDWMSQWTAQDLINQINALEVFTKTIVVWNPYSENYWLISPVFEKIIRSDWSIYSEILIWYKVNWVTYNTESEAIQAALDYRKQQQSEQWIYETQYKDIKWSTLYAVIDTTTWMLKWYSVDWTTKTRYASLYDSQQIPTSWPWAVFYIWTQDWVAKYSSLDWYLSYSVTPNIPELKIPETDTLSSSVISDWYSKNNSQSQTLWTWDYFWTPYTIQWYYRASDWNIRIWTNFNWKTIFGNSWNDLLLNIQKAFPNMSWEVTYSYSWITPNQYPIEQYPEFSNPAKTVWQTPPPPIEWPWTTNQETMYRIQLLSSSPTNWYYPYKVLAESNGAVLWFFASKDSTLAWRNQTNAPLTFQFESDMMSWINNQTTVQTYSASYTWYNSNWTWRTFAWYWTTQSAALTDAKNKAAEAWYTLSSPPPTSWTWTQPPTSWTWTQPPATWTWTLYYVAARKWTTAPFTVVEVTATSSLNAQWQLIAQWYNIYWPASTIKAEAENMVIWWNQEAWITWTQPPPATWTQPKTQAEINASLDAYVATWKTIQQAIDWGHTNKTPWSAEWQMVDNWANSKWWTWNWSAWVQWTQPPATWTQPPATWVDVTAKEVTAPNWKYYRIYKDSAWKFYFFSQVDWQETTKIPFNTLAEAEAYINTNNAATSWTQPPATWTQPTWWTGTLPWTTTWATATSWDYPTMLLMNMNAEWLRVDPYFLVSQVKVQNWVNVWWFWVYDGSWKMIPPYINYAEKIKVWDKQYWWNDINFQDRKAAYEFVRGTSTWDKALLVSAAWQMWKQQAEIDFYNKLASMQQQIVQSRNSEFDLTNANYKKVLDAISANTKISEDWKKRLLEIANELKTESDKITDKKHKLVWDSFALKLTVENDKWAAGNAAVTNLFKNYNLSDPQVRLTLSRKIDADLRDRVNKIESEKVAALAWIQDDYRKTFEAFSWLKTSAEKENTQNQLNTQLQLAEAEKAKATELWNIQKTADERNIWIDATQAARASDEIASWTQLQYSALWQPLNVSVAPQNTAWSTLQQFTNQFQDVNKTTVAQK